MRRLLAIVAFALALPACLRIRYDRCEEIPPHPECADAGVDAGPIDAATADAGDPDSGPVDGGADDAGNDADPGDAGADGG